MTEPTEGIYKQNYRNGDGQWKTVILTSEETREIRKAHREHCKQIMKECKEDYPKDKDSQAVVFQQRADKIFTRLQQALDDKVRRARK